MILGYVLGCFGLVCGLVAGGWVGGIVVWLWSPAYDALCGG